MSGNSQKIPFAKSINQFVDNKLEEALQQTGRAFPCHVISVSGSIVTVAFDIQTTSTIPQVTIPVFGPEYIRYPIQIGDKGYTIPADASLKGVTGLGTGTATTLTPANLTGLVFFPIGNVNWQSVDGNALVMYGPNGVVLRDADSNSIITLTPSGIVISGQNSIVASVGNSEISITESKIDITSQVIALNGVIQLNGPITQGTSTQGTSAQLIGPLNVTNDVVAQGKSLASHVHDVNNVQAGGSTITTTAPD